MLLNKFFTIQESIMGTHPRIIFCEYERQVSWLLTQKNLISSGFSIIATSLEASWALKKHNLDYRPFDEFQKNKSPKAIEALQAGQVAWAQKVDTFLQENNPDFMNSGFRPALHYLSYLKISWDTHIHFADLLEAVSAELEPADILYFPDHHPIQYASDMTRSDSGLAECIPPWARHHGITTTPLLLPMGGDVVFRLPEHLRHQAGGGLAAKLPRDLVHLIQSFIHNPFWSHLPSGHLPFGRKPKVLIRTQYDVTPEISEQLWKGGILPVSFEIAVARSRKYATPLPPTDRFLADFWDPVADQEWFWQPNGWQEWSLREGLEPLFRTFWFNVIPEVWEGMHYSERYLRAEKPHAVCVPSVWGPLEIGFTMAAHSEKVPVIFYQHGASMGDIENTLWDLLDCMYGDYVLTYGEGVADYVRSRQQFNGLTTVPVPVGSTRLDQVGNGITVNDVQAIRLGIHGDPTAPVIVYVPGIPSETFFRYDYIDIRNSRLFATRLRLAEVFHNHLEVRLVYKLFGSVESDPAAEMLKSVCPECTIINDIPLTKLQWAADLVIHETPSTGMFECLMTDKPLIVYVDRDIYRMPCGVRDLLGRRAIVTETGDELAGAVQQFLEKGDFSPLVNPDREFVRRFCTHEDDGKSAVRAARAIAGIAKGHAGVD